MGKEIVVIEPADTTPSGDMFIAVLKGVVGSLIPPVGQGIEAFANWRSRVKQERINQFFNDTIRQIEQKKVDYNFLRTEEFSDLLEIILQKISVTANDSKRAYFRKILIGAIHGQHPPDMSTVFFDILGEITIGEIELLERFHELSRSSLPEQNAPLSLKLDKDRVEDLGYKLNDFRILIQSMIRKGLLYDDGPGRYGVRPYELIRITELGVAFYEYLTGKQP